MKINGYMFGVVALVSIWTLLLPQANAHNVQGHASYPLQEDVYTPAPNLFTGSFQYSIPIETPNGRNGVQPKLALTYDSGNGAGWLGVGWDINLGSIERSTKKGVSYTGDNYILRLGGSVVELVNVGGSDYREKYQNAFYRITKVGTDPNISWIVTDKAGTRYYFGQTSASQQYQTINTEIFSWHLDTVVDSNGNTMTISYAADQGQLYPKSILYAGNTGLYAPYHRNRDRFI